MRNLTVRSQGSAPGSAPSLTRVNTGTPLAKCIRTINLMLEWTAITIIMFCQGHMYQERPASRRVLHRSQGSAPGSAPSLSRVNTGTPLAKCIRTINLMLEWMAAKDSAMTELRVLATGGAALAAAQQVNLGFRFADEFCT
jgi:hypothetical protein